MKVIFIVLPGVLRFLFLMCSFQVSTDFVRLHIDGEIVGQKPLSSLLHEDWTLRSLRNITLASIGGDDFNLQGYVHDVEVLPPNLSVKDHHGKVNCSFVF